MLVNCLLNPDFWNPSFKSKFNAQNLPSVVSTVSLTNDEVTSTKNSKFQALPCLPSKLTCQSTNPSVSSHISDKKPVVKPSPNVSSITGKPLPPTPWMKALKPTRSSPVFENEKVKHLLSLLWTDSTTSCKQIISFLFKKIITSWFLYEKMISSHLLYY